MDVDLIDVSGAWWRQIPAGGDVHHWPEDPADGRWQRGEVVEALYFADSPDTAWAEWYRYIAEVALPPAQALPRDLWQWSIDVTAIADLSDLQRLDRAGLPMPAPGITQWPAFQAVGEMIWGDGASGLLAPSAAKVDGLVLCLFRIEREVDGAKPQPPPRSEIAPPLVPRGLRT